jgi:hypothetical protein
MKENKKQVRIAGSLPELKPDAHYNISRVEVKSLFQDAVRGAVT